MIHLAASEDHQAPEQLISHGFGRSPIEVPEQPRGEFPPTDPAARTGDEKIRLTRSDRGATTTILDPRLPRKP
jgi:hypothetical protein